MGAFTSTSTVIYYLPFTSFKLFKRLRFLANSPPRYGQVLQMNPLGTVRLGTNLPQRSNNFFPEISVSPICHVTGYSTILDCSIEQNNMKFVINFNLSLPLQFT